MTTWRTRLKSSLTTFWSETIALLLLAIVAALGLGVAGSRFLRSLCGPNGPNDASPWSIWISFDAFVVPFSVGAFTLAAVVYLLGDERHYVAAVSLVVAALLGGIVVCAVLLADLGLPDGGRKIVASLNPVSFLLQMSWYVMLYAVIIGLELSPASRAQLGWEGPHRLVNAFIIAAVSAGVILSSLHPSVLGSTPLPLQARLHVLWRTPFLPFLSLLTGPAGTLCVVILVSVLAAKAFQWSVRTEVLANLGRVAAGFLMLYGLLKLLDLLLAGELGLFTGSVPSLLFWAEFLLGIVLPALILGLLRLRTTCLRLLWGAVVGLSGLPLNQANISTCAIWRPTGMSDALRWAEVAILVGAVAAAVLVFALATRFLPLREPLAVEGRQA